MGTTRRLLIDNAGRHRLATREQFDKDPLACHADDGKRLLHVGHETIRTAQIHNRVRSYTDGLEHRSGKMSLAVEVLSDPIVAAWMAMGDIAGSVCKSRHQAAAFCRQRLGLA